MRKRAMRPRSEILKAHDTLYELAKGNLPMPMHPRHAQTVQAALEALAWVLGLEYSDSFASNLDKLYAQLKEHGYTMGKGAAT